MAAGWASVPASSVLALLVACFELAATATAFDHGFAAYGDLLQSVVHGPRVDYAALDADRRPLDRIVATFAEPAQSEEQSWSREQRMAFWINAYNVLTLRAIVSHYPIRAGVFTVSPRNSIRQIDGVWTTLAWDVAGRRVTLDDIEHRILRPTFADARVHFAINCASISCPLLADVPYRAETLDAALDAAARRYLSSAEGLRVDGDTVSVSSIFKWYGDDFISQYSPLAPNGRNARERAILGTIVRFGPAQTAERVRTGRSRIKYLHYDWSLNDLAR
ncbi:MAG: DUF547 domain-containing protein [Acidobacteria bacterium]|nr:DUF547 domain-containing protein [Acidobacteriota bacterium]